MIELKQIWSVLKHLGCWKAMFRQASFDDEEEKIWNQQEKRKMNILSALVSGLILPRVDYKK